MHLTKMQIAVALRPCVVVGIAMFLILALGTRVAIADSWVAPAPFEVSSGNAEFVAMVQPRRNAERPPRAAIYKVQDGKRVLQWDAQLVNEIAPVSALISEDGEYLVTLDNHYSVGYGNDVLAIYGRSGLIRKYSLEQILGEIPQIGWDVSKSVSSRWWRNHSFTLFAGSGKEARFGIWLGWVGRWFVWQLSDGTSVKLAADELVHWNELARRWAHEKLDAPPVDNRPAKEEMRKWTKAAMEWSGRKSDRYQNQITACRVLAYSREPKDRAIIEQLLDNEEADVNWELTLRKTADRALAIQDGVATDFKFAIRREDDRFYRLGTVDLTIDLPSAPGKDPGQVYVSIFPESVAEKDWRSSHPAFRGERTLGVTSTTQQSALNLKVPPLKPGRYWVKAVWDRASSHAFNLYLYEGAREWKESPDPAPQAGAGDMESGPPDFFEVKAGEKAQVRVKCDRPGTNSTRR